MHLVYENDDLPCFADKTARALLAEARNAYRDLGLVSTGMLERDGTTYIFPWVGTVTINTLALALRETGLPAAVHRLIIEVDRTATDKVRSGLSTLSETDEPDPVHLANSVRNVERQKFDRFLPRPLLLVGFASDRIAPDAVRALSRKLVRSSVAIRRSL